MGEMADDAFDQAMEEMFDEDYESRAPERILRCSRCGTRGLYWQQVWTDAGDKWRLFSNGKKHVCTTRASADEFPDA